MVNPNDEEAFKRIINYPTRGIGDTTVGKIIGTATQHGVSLWEVISQPTAYGLNVNKGTLAKLEGFRTLINGFIEQANNTDAYELGTAIIKASGIMSELMQDRTAENMSRQENIEELVNGLQDFTQTHREEDNEHIYLTDYLSEVSLLTDLDSDEGDDGAKVTIMTIHSAKGLEFGTVFVVGMEENLFPNQMASGSIREMEEERRLFYVALTRAEEQCYLTHAQNRYRFGKSEFCSPSIFLREIDSCYLEVQQSGGERQRKPVSRFGSRSPFESESPFKSENPFRSESTSRSESPLGSRSYSEPTTARPTFSLHSTTAASQPAVSSTQTAAGILVIGSHIEHARFGRGEVIALAGSGIDAKATVKFENVGTKQLLLRFAKFTIL